MEKKLIISMSTLVPVAVLNMVALGILTIGKGSQSIAPQAKIVQKDQKITSIMKIKCALENKGVDTNLINTITEKIKSSQLTIAQKEKLLEEINVGLAQKEKSDIEKILKSIIDEPDNTDSLNKIFTVSTTQNVVKEEATKTINTSISQSKNQQINSDMLKQTKESLRKTPTPTPTTTTTKSLIAAEQIEQMAKQMQTKRQQNKQEEELKTEQTISMIFQQKAYNIKFEYYYKKITLDVVTKSIRESINTSQNLPDSETMLSNNIGKILSITEVTNQDDIDKIAFAHAFDQRQNNDDYSDYSDYYLSDWVSD